MAQHLRFVTWNVCVSSRAVGKYAKYSDMPRCGAVVNRLVAADADIVCLQEVSGITASVIADRMSTHAWFFASEVRHGIVSMLGIGVRRSKYCASSCAVDLLSTGMSESSTIIDARVWAGPRPSGPPLLNIVNVHAPVSDTGRADLASALAEHTKRSTTRGLVIAGDFNSFPDRDGAAQMEEICMSTGCANLTLGARNVSNDNVALRSFEPYPFDHVPPEAREVPGKLDHVLARGWKVAEETRPRVDDTLSKLIGFNPSDHMMLFVELESESAA